jgi:hypothetical protein
VVGAAGLGSATQDEARRAHTDEPAPRPTPGRIPRAQGPVFEHSLSGARGNFDRDSADAVVRADPTKFSLVPPSQYRTTD